MARCGSVRRAAESLNIAASAVDRQVVLAEESLGAPLFERLPTGLRLTAAGEILLHHARTWAKELAIVRSEIDELRGLRRGSVSIAMIEALSLGLLPKLLFDFKAAHRFIDLHLHVHNVRGITEAVAALDVDFGLTLDPEPLKGVATRLIAAFPLGFVFPRGHALEGSRTARPSTAAGMPVIIPAEPLTLARHALRIEAASGVTFQRTATSNNIQMIKSLVSAGAGISVLSAIDVHEEVRRGELGFVPIEASFLKPLGLALCTAPARQLSRAANAVMAQLEQGLSQAFGFGPDPASWIAPILTERPSSGDGR